MCCVVAVALYSQMLHQCNFVLVVVRVLCETDTLSLFQCVCFTLKHTLIETARGLVKYAPKFLT